MRSGNTGAPSAWTSRASGFLGARASRPLCHLAGLRPACGRDARAPRFATGAWFRLRRVGRTPQRFDPPAGIRGRVAQAGNGGDPEGGRLPTGGPAPPWAILACPSRR